MDTVGRGNLMFARRLVYRSINQHISPSNFYKTIFIYIGFGGVCVWLVLYVTGRIKRVKLYHLRNIYIHSMLSDESVENSQKLDLFNFRINWIEIIRTGIFGLLPIVNWYASMLFFPTHGYYGGYNGFNITSFSPVLFISGVQYIKDGILAHFFDKSWSFGFLALVLIVVAIIGFNLKGYRIVGLGIFIVGCILLATGIFPYLVRDTPAASSGSYTRNLILVSIPMSIIFIAFLRWAFSGNLLFTRVAIIIGFLLAIEFSVEYIQSYLEWQGRTVWEKSLVLNLKDQPEFMKNSVLWVDSGFTELGKIGDPELNEPLVWIGLFRQASGDESHFGTENQYLGDDIYQRKPDQYEHKIQSYFELIQHFGSSGIGMVQRRDMWLVSDFDPYGCQGILSIIRGDGAQSAIRSAITYYYYKFFKPDQMENYLKQLTQLKITHLDTPLATNCIR